MGDRLRTLWQALQNPLEPGQNIAVGEHSVVGTLGGNQHQHPIWVIVYRAGDRGVGILGQRVGYLGFKRNQLVGGGDNLSPDEAVRVIGEH